MTMMIDYSCFLDPEKKFPDFSATPADKAFLDILVSIIGQGENRPSDAELVDAAFSETGFPKKYERLTLILYAPGHKRIVVSRQGRRSGFRFSDTFMALMAHPRLSEPAGSPFKVQMDFIREPAQPVNFYTIGMGQSGDKHFEIGVDGLEFRGKDDKLHLFLPGDAFVRSIMGMTQLREYLHKAHGEEYLRQAEFKRFHSDSFLSGEDGWLRLYRGYPLVGALTKQKLEHALDLAIGHIRLTQQNDGKFLYYYDAALNSRRDHEHPKRNLENNPYYNILRHCGGALTCMFHEKYTHRQDTLENIRLAIEYLLKNARIQDYDGRPGAYIYSERKSKLGGAGIALYTLVEYQLLTGDSQYAEWAGMLAWHLLHQVTQSGEFIYYNIYLDQPVGEEQNQNYFSFYYPGEAVCGLARYYQIAGEADRRLIIEKLTKALEFLLVVRPGTRAEHYTSIPSDSWLMMGIMEAWNIEELRNSMYSEFVYSDARKMIDHMYKVDDAPYPDYAGAYYYEFGDYPFADGARCEGLLGAYELALKQGDAEMAARIWPALRLAAWALMHLVNTEDAIYFARNPAISLGGIRFKYTRQWFRIDTIQHVASFFAKLMPYWERNEEQPASRV